ncbi:MAG: AI-2E family transporter [Actinomycetes bacterium]
MVFLRRRSTAPPERAVPAPVPATPAAVDGSVEIPYGVRLAAAWSWRLLLIAAAVAVAVWGFGRLSVVLVPVIIALLVAAVASPIVDRLQERGMPRGLATALVILSGVVVIAGLITLIAQQVSSGFDDLRSSFQDSLDQLQSWLVDLGLSRQQLSDVFDRLRDAAGSGADEGLGGTLVNATATVGHIVAGLFIALFATIFFVYDGRRIWSWLVGLFPAGARDRVQGSGVRAWAVLTSYVRATVLIALTDAVGIALVALVLRLPLVLPIGVLVFLGAFIPVVGATISGTVAVAVALVTHGPVAALVMLGGVIAVQQLESHVLQPFLMGRMVRVHPLAVVLVIAIGGLTAGIFGALVAVPLAAIVNTVARYLAGERQRLTESDTGAAGDPAVT